MPSFTIAIRSVYLKHKNVVVNGSDIVRSASVLFQFYIKIRCRYGCRKVGRGFFDLVLQIVTYFENKPTYLLNLNAQVVRNIFFPYVMVTGKSSLL